MLNTDAKPVHIINAYGPTENTTFSTAYLINQHKALPDSLPIGKPITGTEVYILGDGLHLKALNAPGRLFVGGLGLAQGYLNSKELTHAKFVANPYMADDIIYDTSILRDKLDLNTPKIRYCGWVPTTNYRSLASFQKNVFGMIYFSRNK